MKKICVILIICMSFSFLFAMRNGITVGYNSSNYIPKEETNINMPGFRLGGISQLPVAPFLLQSEYLLSTKGFLSHSIGDTRLTNLFLYLELPISMKYELFKQNEMNIFVSGGFYAAIKILAINLVSEIDGVRSFDAGAQAGCGVRYKKMELECRFSQSFVNFDLIDTRKFHQTVSLGLNFFFRDK